VQVLERVTDLQGYFYDRLLGQLPASLVQLLLERDAVDKFHHQVVPILLAEAIEDPRDMFVGELREHVGFTLERGNGLLLHLGTGKRIHHFRQRRGTRGQPQILGEIDHFHAAAAERFDDAITSANYGVGCDHWLSTVALQKASAAGADSYVDCA
jgi:hypothetical protein